MEEVTASKGPQGFCSESRLLPTGLRLGPDHLRLTGRDQLGPAGLDLDPEHPAGRPPPRARPPPAGDKAMGRPRASYAAAAPAAHHGLVRDVNLVHGGGGSGTAAVPNATARRVLSRRQGDKQPLLRRRRNHRELPPRRQWWATVVWVAVLSPQW